MTLENSILRSPMSRAEIRAVDQIAIQQFGMSGLVLMENAGRNAAEAVHRLSPNGEICILCGKGNNGGDGYVIARHLELLGRNVRIVSLVDPADLSGDAADNHLIATRGEIPIQIETEPSSLAVAIGQPSVVVDCMLGTGAEGEPREPIKSAIGIVNQLNTVRIAVDIPSGLDCDTGEVSKTTFKADHTLTFVATKKGFVMGTAATVLGRVEVLSIGVPAKLLKDLARL